MKINTITNRPNIEYRKFRDASYSAETIYINFYNFLLEQSKQNEKDIKNKEMKYLFKTYSHVISVISKQKENKNNHLKLLYFNKKSKDKFEKYTTNCKDEYLDFYENVTTKGYAFYNNLSSWYLLNVVTTNKIIDNLNATQLNTTNNEKKYLKKKIYSNIIKKTENKEINYAMKG